MVQLRDIAQKAGVSVPTASRALSGRGYASAEVRERVQRIAGRLGYRPNRSAQRLRGGASDEVAMIAFSLNELAAARLTPFERAMREAGYRCTLMAGRPTSQELDQITGELVAGRPAAVLTDRVVDADHRAAIERLRDVGMPCLVMDSRRGGEWGIAIDRARGVTESIDHLVARGHRRIAYVGLPADPSRVDVYVRATAGHGLEPVIIDIDPGADRYGQGRAAFDRVLEAGSAKVTAVQAYNDEVAFGLIAAATDRGLEIPGDLAVVGFDDLRAASWVTPALTTVAHPHEAAGRLAAEMLLREIEDGATDGAPTDRTTLPMRLVVRQSA